eukprot:TRINITY_DN29590_c0_g1_i1.p1 TRINITY_DN29590_c0_g1~~TRINITY_DN29590_c0_g1_i1.p1  ORF type:complete len:336 (-),score=99.33 TRINITY_DN29590_c0_g1_i1:72-1079(-)
MSRAAAREVQATRMATEPDVATADDEMREFLKQLVDEQMDSVRQETRELNKKVTALFHESRAQSKLQKDAQDAMKAWFERTGDLRSCEAIRSLRAEVEAMMVDAKQQLAAQASKLEESMQQLDFQCKDLGDKLIQQKISSCLFALKAEELSKTQKEKSMAYFQAEEAKVQERITANQSVLSPCSKSRDTDGGAAAQAAADSSVPKTATDVAVPSASQQGPVHQAIRQNAIAIEELDTRCKALSSKLVLQALASSIFCINSMNLDEKARAHCLKVLEERERVFKDSKTASLDAFLVSATYAEAMSMAAAGFFPADISMDRIVDIDAAVERYAKREL